MTPPDTITAPQFQALCALLWGDDWRRKAADALGVNLRNVQFWAAEPPARSKPVPAGVVAELFGEVNKAVGAPGGYLTLRAEAVRMADQLEILIRAIGVGDIYVQRGF